MPKACIDTMFYFDEQCVLEENLLIIPSCCSLVWMFAYIMYFRTSEETS